MTSEKLKIPNRKALNKKYQAQLQHYEQILAILQETIKHELDKIVPHSAVKARVKTFDNYYNKILRLLSKLKNREEAFFIYDVLGLRIVCPFLEDLKTAEALVKQKFHVVEVQHKGNQYSFKEFGYQSIHFLIKTPPAILSRFQIKESLFCEIQLRTILQDAWSEVEHELVYKTDFSPFDEPLKRKLAALNATLTLSDTLFQEIRNFQNHLQSELKKRRETFLCDIATDNTGNTVCLSPDNTSTDRGHSKTKDPASSFKANQKNIDDLLMEALNAHNGRQFEKAISIYSSILNLNIQEHIKSIIYIHRGMAFFAVPLYDRAMEDFTKAIELNRENYKAFYYRGLTCQILNDYHRALTNFNQCLELNPCLFDPLYNRAQVRLNLGDYENALHDCEQALNLQPESSQAQNLQKLIKSCL